MTREPTQQENAQEQEQEQAPPPEGAGPEDEGAPPEGAPAAGHPPCAGPASDVAADLDPQLGGPASTVAADLDQLVATAAQRDEYLALAQRTQADFENYRKRMSREVALAGERGVARLTKELLPALDNLERALAAAGGDSGPLRDGVALVADELTAALARAGVQSFRPDGEPFDPQCHEAMASQPVEGAESGAIVEVYQSGYRLGETVIRPARVVVAA